MTSTRALILPPNQWEQTRRRHAPASEINIEIARESERSAGPIPWEHPTGPGAVMLEGCVGRVNSALAQYRYILAEGAAHLSGLLKLGGMEALKGNEAQVNFKNGGPS